MVVRQLRWALVWLFAFATPAYAGNDDALLVGGEASMTGGAVVATTETGAALYYNPAGLAGAEHDSLNLSGSAYTLRLYQTPALLTSVDGEEASATVRELVVNTDAPVDWTQHTKRSARCVSGAPSPCATPMERDRRSAFCSTRPLP